MKFMGKISNCYHWKIFYISFKWRQRMKKREENGFVLLPIIVFLIIFLGVGIGFKDFYYMPVVVAFLISLLVAFMQNRKLSFEKKIDIIARGIGEENIVTMCLIFLCAGAFSGAVTAAGGVENTVNFGLSILPSKYIVVGLFIIGCFISISMGTSMGTIVALSPIAVEIGEKTGVNMGLCMGAVLCGAMFGDNLSMISDTTIAAVKTQGCEIKDKFKENFLIVLPAAILTGVIFLLMSKNTETVINEELSYNILNVLPYVMVFLGALTGLNVFIVLITGTVFSLIIGVITNNIKISEIFIAIGGGTINGRNISGVTGMYDITIISIIIACIVALIKENGGIRFILNKIKKRIKSKKGAEYGIAGVSALVDICTANNTVAVVMAGPVVKEISDEYKISPKNSASILDIFTSAIQGLLPYGTQILSASAISGITPFEIFPYLYYPALMAMSGLLFIRFRN